MRLLIHSLLCATFIAGAAAPAAAESGIVACGSVGYRSTPAIAQGDLTGSKIWILSPVRKELLADLRRSNNPKFREFRHFKMGREFAHAIHAQVLDAMLFYDRNVRMQRVFRTGREGLHPPVMVGEIGRLWWFKDLVGRYVPRRECLKLVPGAGCVKVEPDSQYLPRVKRALASKRFVCKLIWRKKVCPHPKYKKLSIPCAK